MDIHFHTNISDVNATIQKNLPASNQGFQNSSIGSNVFDVIEEFFSNTETPVCGSIVLILLKRYPNEADNSSDTSQLVSLIRSHHAIVNVITSTTPSGGSESKTMYSVASKTNGMGAFEPDECFYEQMWYFPIAKNIYPVYATTVWVYGSGTRTLPGFHSPIRDYSWIEITYQDHAHIDSFQYLNLRWFNFGEWGNFSVNSNDVSDKWYGGTFIANRNMFNRVNYNMALDYNYLGDDLQPLQIRIYNNEPTSNWLPYSDY